MTEFAQPRRIALKEGRILVDGQPVADAVALEAVFKPNVNESKAPLGQEGVVRRYIGYDITGKVTQYKRTPFVRDLIKKYLQTKKTPVFTIQGKQDDTSSDYYEEYGEDVITMLGCVFTGDLPLMSIDGDSTELVKEELEFGAQQLAF